MKKKAKQIQRFYLEQLELIFSKTSASQNSETGMVAFDDLLTFEI